MRTIAFTPLCILLTALALHADERMYAKAVNERSVATSLNAAEISGFILNNQKDRVGVELSVYRSRAALMADFGTDDDRGPEERITYIFPELTYDKERKQIRLGDQVVTRRNFKLGYTVTKQECDHGFDRSSRKVYKVYLEKVD